MLPEPVEALPTIAGGDEEGGGVGVWTGVPVMVSEGVALGASDKEWVGVTLDVAVAVFRGVFVAVIVEVAVCGVFVPVALAPAAV